MVDLGGPSLFLHEWGEPDAPPLLFVHGSGDDGGQAAPLAEAISGAWWVVSPDAPGHGRSPSVEPDGYLPSRVAALLAALLAELGIGSAVLAGFSWGASICCHLAARYPDSARSLVLLEGGHIDFADARGFDPSALTESRDAPTAMGRGLVREPVVPTYPALRESGVPVLLVTALRDEALDQLRADPLRRLEQEVPQATVARVRLRGHDLLGSDDGTVVNIVREWLARFAGSHGSTERQ